MEAEYISTIITGVITVVTGGFVFQALKERIQTQKEQVELMQKNMDTMQKVVEMFNTDEMAEWIKKKEEIIRHEAQKENQATIQKLITEEWLPARKQLEQQLHELDMQRMTEQKKRLETVLEYQQKNDELVVFILTILVLMNDNQIRANVIADSLPLNKEYITEIMKDMPEEIVQSVRSKVANSVLKLFN